MQDNPEAFFSACVQMRVVIQRVAGARLTADGVDVGIDGGLFVLVGVGKGDEPEEGGRAVEKLAVKVCNLRIFDDDCGRMNLSLLDTKGDILIVSQFTLYGDCRKGNRPSFVGAATPETANRIYEVFVEEVRKLAPGRVETGVFGAHMRIELTNDGPVTIVMDTERWSAR